MNSQQVINELYLMRAECKENLQNWQDRQHKNAMASNVDGEQIALWRGKILGLELAIGILKNGLDTADTHCTDIPEGV